MIEGYYLGNASEDEVTQGIGPIQPKTGNRAVTFACRCIRGSVCEKRRRIRMKVRYPVRREG